MEGCSCAGELADLRVEIAALRAEVARLAAVVEGRPPQTAGVPVPAVPGPMPAGARVDVERVAAERVALFRSLFVGRDDVYASRWERDGRQGWSPALDREPGQSWEEAKKARRYRPLTDAVIRDHLSGAATIGLYPMLADDTCRLLVCDFDGADWQLDAQAYAQAAQAAGVPAAVEISRSGQGAHVWIFFEELVPALDARAVGFGLLREAMAVRGGLGLDSYDRFFPAQDHLPAAGEGLGNLIALPLQKERRAHQTTIFVDPDTFIPMDDQWGFLAGLGRLSRAEVQRLAVDMRPVTVGPDTRWFRPALAHEPAPPPTIHAEWAGMLAVRRAGLPPSLLATLKHAASLANPAFYKNENLRISNWNTPRFIRCYVEDLEFLYLPRAMTGKAADLVRDAGSRLKITDRRADPPSLEVAFTGTLRDAQPAAVAALAHHDLGVLEAPPGSGKTVMGCALIAHHHTPTLIMVDRAPLMDQRRDRLTAYLNITADRIGRIGGGKTKPTGVIDLAMMQTPARMDDAPERLPAYGLVIVDEAHHAGAPTVEKAVRRIPARRWIGLTATAYRRDGLGPVIFMHCGPKRHVIPIVDPAAPGPVARVVHLHRTDFTLPDDADTTRPGAITSVVFTALTENTTRNQMICADVHTAVTAGRNCLVLTRRTAHVDALADLPRRSGSTA
ncbi:MULTISPECIES: TOTE conflict system archaeo-eukaryotic primase domain-containing protein [Protofrankia]|uniref:TOTE conflict system archaeo-eukaryotic primase domain-containing protein n=1 Tax=Protofrankia TaxID=2994361 RepID=UPI00069CACB8|nr:MULTISPECIES: DEAD/DEAH box helicase family protein [Protofrankia]ONH35135.1 hypothetical protein BL254_13185 [Protofrankia sp. BMG5.30]